MSAEQDIPIVKVELRNDVLGGLRFWCPFCQVYHQHGRGEGHRSAHCSTKANSPFTETGYILRIDPPEPSKDYAKRFARATITRWGVSSRGHGRDGLNG